MKSDRKRKSVRAWVPATLIALSLCTVLAESAAADRGMARIEDQTLVADNGRLLRGTRWSLDLAGNAPPDSFYDNLKAAGLNTLHIYAESFAEARCQGYKAGHRETPLIEMVNTAGQKGIYVVITIGNGSSQHDQGIPGCDHANGSHDPDYVRDFWEHYAGMFAGRSHVIYEIQNEPYYNFGTGQSQPSSPALRSLEREVHDQIRSVAPNTPVLFYSYAVLTDGPAAHQDLQALGSVDWSKAAVAFHGYGGLGATTTALDYLLARGYPMIQTEFYDHSNGGQKPDIGQTEAYEVRRTSWLTFVDLSVIANPANFRAPIDNGQLTWVADFGTWPATSNPPIGSTVTLQRPLPDGRYAFADTSVSFGNPPIFADSTTVTSKERFQVVAYGPRHVALRSEANGRYVWPNSNGVLRARMGSPVPFEWLDRSDGLVALRSQNNNLFVAPQGSGRPRLIANQTRGGGALRGFVVGNGAPPDLPPNAAFSSSCNALSCSFNASASSDDGGIVSYAWSFGDGFSGSGVATSHFYGSGGTYTVRLTVTDTAGQTDTETRTVTVSPANQPPNASFTTSCSNLACSFNAAGSSDDGGIVGYAWSFGDGSNGSGLAPSHTYGSGGTYTVWLTVTDGGGLTDSTSRSVTVSPPTGSCVANGQTLCLVNNRFRITLSWVDPSGSSMAGNVVSGDGFASAGFFWFFTSTNLEVGVKILDGTAVNGKFWLYHGAITDLQYTLNVTDTVTGTSKSYSKAAGSLCGGGDVNAFPQSLTGGGLALESWSEDVDLLPAFGFAGTCTSSPTQACLIGNRFRVRALRGGTAQGAVRINDGTAAFTFFSPDNPEIFLKILDAAVINGQFWLYWGSITDQSYQIEITDTVAETSRVYSPPGPLCGSSDVNAFPSP